MGQNLKWLIIIGFFALAPSMIAQDKRGSVLIRLFDRAGLGFSTITSGEKDASALLSGAGVETVWLNCSSGTSACVKSPNPTKLILTILPSGSRMGGTDVLGTAIQDAQGSGAYCYVFEDKLNEIAAQMHITTSRLLGYAMAHEIGHLLKGSHSHSLTGVMSAHWSKNELQRASVGLLQFTREDAIVMRSHLADLWSTLGDIPPVVASESNFKP